MDLKFLVVFLLLGLEESISAQENDDYEHSFQSMVSKHRAKRTTCDCTCASGAAGRGVSGMQTNRAARPLSPSDGSDKGPMPPGGHQGPGPVKTPSGDICPKEPGDINKHILKSGCYSGYCWTGCFGLLGTRPNPTEWCYTTKGPTQDHAYVGCTSDNECCTYWNCAGPCTL